VNEDINDDRNDQADDQDTAAKEFEGSIREAGDRAMAQVLEELKERQE